MVTKIDIKKIVWKIGITNVVRDRTKREYPLALKVDNMDVGPTEVTFQIENKDVKEGQIGDKSCIHHYLMLYLNQTLEFERK